MRVLRHIMIANMDMSTGPGHAPHDADPSPEPVRRDAARRRTSPILLVLVFVGFISLGLPDGLLGVAWPSIRQTFGLPLDAIVALFLTAVCGYFTASLTSGWVVQRIGIGMLLALSALATSACLFAFAFAPVWGVIVVAGVLGGLGAGAIDSGLNSYVALAHSPRLLTWLHACFGVGAAIGLAIMMAVLDAGQPWQLGYVIVASGLLMLGICFLLTRRQWQVAPEPDSAPQSGAASGVPTELADGHPVGVGQAPPEGARNISGDKVILRWPSAVWLSILLIFVYTGIETAAGGWSYTLFVEGRGVSPRAAGLAVSAYWGGLALGRVFAGLIANRVAPAALTRWSMIGMLVGAVLLRLDLVIWLSIAGLVLMGLAAAPVFPSLIGVTPLRFGAGSAPTIIRFQVAAAALGIAGLPALAGVLAARVGLEVIPLLLVIASAGMVALHEVVVRLAARAADRAVLPLA